MIYIFMNKLGKVIALVLILGMLQLCESSLGREMVVGKNIEEGGLKGLKVEEAK